MNLNDETKKELRNAVFVQTDHYKAVKRLKDASRNNDIDRCAAVSIVYKVSNWYRNFGTTPPRGVRKVGVNILEDGVPLPNWKTFRSGGGWEYNFQLYFDAVETVLCYAVAQDSTVYITEDDFLAEFGAQIKDFLRPMWESENASIDRFYFSRGRDRKNTTTYEKWWQQATGQVGIPG